MAANSSRQQQLDEIAHALPARVSELSNLFLRRTVPAVSRTDVAVMQRLAQGAKRITELAAAEQMKQPGITLLVNRMEERGWAVRSPDPADGRAVLVSLTAAGHAEIASLEAAYLEMLADHLAALDDSQVQALVQAVEVLDAVIAHLNEP